MSQENFRLLSKKEYTDAPGATAQNINIGSLQRIADAAEMVAKNYQQLQADAERWKNTLGLEVAENDRLHKRIDALHRSIASYKGQITKLKNKGKLNWKPVQS